MFFLETSSIVVESYYVLFLFPKIKKKIYIITARRDLVNKINKPIKKGGLGIFYFDLLN